MKGSTFITEVIDPKVVVDNISHHLSEKLVIEVRHPFNSDSTKPRSEVYAYIGESEHIQVFYCDFGFRSSFGESPSEEFKEKVRTVMDSFYMEPPGLVIKRRTKDYKVLCQKWDSQKCKPICINSQKWNTWRVLFRIVDGYAGQEPVFEKLSLSELFVDELSER